MIQLTDDQQFAFDKAIDFLFNDEKESVFVITGQGGTGKSFCAALIVNEILNRGGSVIGVCPTHKAKKVLADFLQNKITVITVASLLGKIRSHSYVGTRRFECIGKDKFSTANIFLVDEISMIDDESMKKIIEYLNNNHKKGLMLGDNYQIPSPSQGMVCASSGNYCFKKDSIAFKIKNRVTLNKVIRQKEGSDILKLATYVRENINSELEIPEEFKISKAAAYDEFITDWRENPSTKFITYTNAAVREHNTAIREKLGFVDKFNVSECIMGYNNIGYPVLIMENGRDYIIEEVKYISNYMIEKYRNIKGHLLKCNSPAPMFFIDVDEKSNEGVLNELISRALAVNAKNSSKASWRKYINMANKILFMNNVYKFNDVIYEEAKFKRDHPLLFTNTNKLISSGKVQENELVNEINILYSSLLSERLTDDKTIIDSEILADMFMILEKSADYGYSLSSHRSQASTFFSVLIDWNDFSKLRDIWNFKYHCQEIRLRESNQLKYVAITRASDKLRIVV